MENQITIRDHIRESTIFVNRSIAAIVIIVLLTLGIIARLFYLQILSHDHFETLSKNNRVNIVSIPPIRGLIYDRNGIVMAENIPTFGLDLIPERISDIEATLKTLAGLISLSERDLKRFRRELRRNKRFNNIPLRFRLSDQEVARLAVNRHRLPGVEIVSNLSRYYPQGSLASHAIGYVGRISEADLRRMDDSGNYRGSTHIGKVGIERAYESILHGTTGLEQIETNAQGRTLRVLERTPPVTGKSLHLHLDTRLQRLAEQAFGEENGALVAIDPKNGGILAMVSMPTYDPNLFINGIEPDEYAKLRDSKHRPLFNRAISGQYPPGSTVKPFLGLAGLENNTIGVQDKIFCKGWYVPEGEDQRRYRDWKRTGHGHTGLSRAISESCDIYFYDLAFHLGIDVMSEFMKHFGFGTKTGVDLIGEMPGLMPSREWKRKVYNVRWFPGESLLTGIGQGYTLATPLQLASATATLSSEGHRLRPHLVERIESELNDEVEYRESEEVDTVELNKDSHWRSIRQAMIRVVHGNYGSARGIAEGLTYRIAGKTGTAQVFGIKEDEEYVAEELEKRLRDHALFIAYAPARDPKIAVALIVENGGGGGSTAAPIARTVIDAYLKGVRQ